MSLLNTLDTVFILVCLSGAVGCHKAKGERVSLPAPTPSAEPSIDPRKTLDSDQTPRVERESQ